MPASDPTVDTSPLTPTQLPDRLRADLKLALAARDKPLVSLLRTTIAALANAEAPPVGPATDPALVGQGDLPRLALSDGQIERILRDEIAERLDAITAYDAGGQPEAAEVLRVEAGVLAGYLDLVTHPPDLVDDGGT